MDLRFEQEHRLEDEENILTCFSWRLEIRDGEVALIRPSFEQLNWRCASEDTANS